MQTFYMSHFKLSFAKKKIIENKRKFLCMSVLILVYCALSIWLGLSQILTRGLWYYITPAGLILLILGLWIGNKIGKKLNAKLDIYQYNWEKAELGNRGEELIYRELQKSLTTDNYKIYQNLKMSGIRSDLDFVVVGLKGIILIEVKNYKDTKIIYTKKESFYKSKIGNNIKIDPDLRDVVHWRAKKLGLYLAKNGIGNIHIRKVIVYVNPDAVDIREFGGNQNRVYLARGAKGLQEYIANSLVDNKLTPEFCAQINNVLGNIK